METCLAGGSCEGGVQLVKILWRNMEAREGVVELVAGEVGEDVVEISEDGADFERVVCILDGFIRMCGGYARNGAPVFAVFVNDVIVAILAWDDLGELPDAWA